MLSIQFYFYIVPTTLLQVFALRVVLVKSDSSIAPPPVSCA